MCSSYLHHFTSDFWKFSNFPIVKHSNFIGLTCKSNILMQCISLEKINKFLNTLTLTLVEVGECFIMQFNSRRGRCTQDILKGKDHILIFWGQAGLLLLEDGKGKNITREKKKERNMKCSVNNTVKPDYLNLTHLLSTKADLWSHDRNKTNRLPATININLPRMIGHYVC